MREYQIQEWKYAVDTTKRLSKQRNYAERFRHDYFVLLGTKKKYSLKLVSFFFSVVVYLNDLRHIFMQQLARPNGFTLDCRYNFYIANNPSYIKTVIPVAEKLVQNKEQVAIFCTSNNYNILRRTIKPELADLLYVIESAKIANSRFKALFIIAFAVFRSFLDGLWFMAQPVKGRFFFSVDFMKYGLSNYCYHFYWQNYFNEKERYLIAANEFHHFEALLFETCRHTVSQSIILAHGRETEISYPIFAKKRFTWGSHDVNLLVNIFGADPSEVEALGSPYFDRIYIEIKTIKSEILNPAEKMITFYGQPYYKMTSGSTDEYDQVLKWFYHLAKGLPSKRFRIKLHPFDDSEYYKDAPENVVLSNENILLSLEKCSIMITIESNSILESAVFGVPAIQCILSGSKMFNDYSNSGISMRAKNEEDLHDLILKLSDDPQFYSKTIEKSELALKDYFANLGHSLDAIIERIR